MLKFYIDRSNLNAVAQCLADLKRFDDIADQADALNVLTSKLKKLYEGTTEADFNLQECPCVWGPVYVMPATAPGMTKTDIVLNLVVRLTAAGERKGDYAPL